MFYTEIVYTLQSPLAPKAHKDYFETLIPTLDYENTIFIPTSGTTSVPKIIANDMGYYDIVANISKDWLGWNKDSVFTNFVPAPTSGFWHAFMPAVVDTDSEIILGAMDTMQDNLNEDASHIVMVPGLVDMLRIRNFNVDLSKYDTVAVGSAQVLDRHVDYIFDRGCKEFTHMYGITEAGVPTLRNKTTEACSDSRCLQHTNEYGIETQLDNGELLIKGSTLCNNIEELGTENGWYRTGDLFEEVGNNIRFVGRTNDIVKLNGYKANLLVIENTIEELADIKECVAIPRNRVGTDWIELQYVGNIGNIEKLKNQLTNILPPCNIPKKFTKIDAVPRNTLNKKIRSLS
jgi:acyl-coenzyme A synthetase/AMP-(fatty) acid ligase